MHVDSLVNVLRGRMQHAQFQQSPYIDPQRTLSYDNTPPQSSHSHEQSQRLRDSAISEVLSRPAGRQEKTGRDVVQLGRQKSRKGRTTEDTSDMTSILPSFVNHTSKLKNPIPAPNIHIKSEYPNLIRSKDAQTLICVVTVEVPDGRWKPSKDELGQLRRIPETRSAQSNHSDSDDGPEDEEDWEENMEDLERAERLLKDRVDNWHGLPFAR